MGKHVDLTGEKYGRLTVESFSGFNKHHQSMWNCSCDCGGSVVVCVAKLRPSCNPSCGCLKREVLAARNSLLPDLVGMRFGRLVVVARAENSNAGKRRFLCACNCGGESVVVYSALKGGRVQSCGCLQREAAAESGKKNLDDLSGRRFGRWIVESRNENANGKPSWRCRCDCGKVGVVLASNLKRGDSTSCGCYQREQSAKALFKHGLSRTPEYMREKSKRKNLRDRQDPRKLLALRVRSLIAKSIEFRGFKKSMKSEQILGCSIETFRKHIERQFAKGMTWENIGEWHVDHIVPMATATGESDVYALNHFTNLRPLWAKDNLKKGAAREFLI